MKLKRFRNYFVITIFFLIVVLIYGNWIFTYFAFRLIGVEIVKVEYSLFDKLEATIRVNSDSITHQIRIGAINPIKFVEGWFYIKEINEYTLINYSCKDSSWERQYCEEKGNFIATQFYSTSINFSNEYVFSYLFGIEECSIPWVIRNISAIEAQLMAIPDDRYSYYRSPRGDEVYFKRVRRESGILNKLMKEVESNDTLFVFQNPDCNPEWLRKSE